MTYAFIPTDEFPASYQSVLAELGDRPYRDVLADGPRRWDEWKERLATLPSGFRYAEGKWTAKEIIGHMADTERILSYRALCFARGDETSLPGFEEDDYVRRANFEDQSWEQLWEGWSAVRRATLHLLDSLPKEALTRTGTANDRQFSVRALFAVLAAHELHHFAVLRERYLQRAEAGAA